MDKEFYREIPKSPFVDAGDVLEQWHGIDVNITKLDAFIEQAVAKASTATNKPTNPKNEIIMLSGGSASEVGAAVKSLGKAEVIDPERALILDSENIIDAKIVPNFNFMTAQGLKHAEKLTPKHQEVYRQLLRTITKRFMDRLEKADIKGTLVIDDHFEDISLPKDIAKMGKEKYGADVGYMCVFKDPRTAIESAAKRTSEGVGTVAIPFLLNTHRLQPRNWKELRDDPNIDAAMLVGLVRQRTTIPRVLEQRIGDAPYQTLDPSEVFAFNCNSDIPDTARTAETVFAKGEEPENLYQKKHGHLEVSGKNFIHRTIYDVLNGDHTPGFVDRVMKNSQSGAER